MPKKNNELKAKARQLYEQGGFSLAEIARKLEINQNTVKSWKKRDKWIAPQNAPTKKEKGAKREVQRASLANLQPIEPGEKRAQKHGLYSNHSDDPEYEEIFQEGLAKSEEELARERIAASRANYIIATKNLDKSNPAYLEPLSRVDASYGNLLKRPSEIHATNLDNQMREYKLEEYRQQLAGESPELEILDRYIEAVDLDAARDAEFDNEDDSDS